ncbi:MAG: hypothetical protein LBI10_07160 [Deltaproteobacteria bacterium]|nr:hypothetical protein [Deltaproteobacteria bacterium]
MKWFQKATDQNQADAQFKLGECYYYGDGAPENKAEALILIQKAAAQGHDKAQEFCQETPLP